MVVNYKDTMDNTVERQEQLKQIKALVMSGQQESIDIAEQTAIGLRQSTIT